MQPYEIFDAVRTWNGCPDRRPWLIVELRANGTLGCLPISGECYHGSSFLIDAGHPDFPQTGLTKTSHVHDARIVELRMGEMKARRGELVRDLLRDFQNQTGL